MNFGLIWCFPVSGQSSSTGCCWLSLSWNTCHESTGAKLLPRTPLLICVSVSLLSSYARNVPWSRLRMDAWAITAASGWPICSTSAQYCSRTFLARWAKVQWRPLSYHALEPYLTSQSRLPNKKVGRWGASSLAAAIHRPNVFHRLWPAAG